MKDTRSRRILMSGRDAVTQRRVVQKLVLIAPVPKKTKRWVPPLGSFVLHAPDGEPFTYVAHREDVMARGIIWDDLATWERGTVVELCERFRSAQRFWDIGAYAGIYTLLACAVNPEISVVAVEPIPQHAKWLRANIAANGWTDRVQVVDAAISDSDGTVEMTVVDDDITASGIGVDRPGKAIQVPSLRLDQLGPAPDIIKIDVEGHEVRALSTGVQMLCDHHPILLAECLRSDALTSMLDFLAPLGYELRHLSATGSTPVENSFAVPASYANFLAVPSREGLAASEELE
jgi:FkbM family methyltransferase